MNVLVNMVYVAKVDIPRAKNLPIVTFQRSWTLARQPRWPQRSDFKKRVSIGGSIRFCRRQNYTCLTNHWVQTKHDWL